MAMTNRIEVADEELERAHLAVVDAARALYEACGGRVSSLVDARRRAADGYSEELSELFEAIEAHTAASEALAAALTDHACAGLGPWAVGGINERLGE